MSDELETVTDMNDFSSKIPIDRMIIEGLVGKL